MILILLPGMDGTGILFKPFLNALPKNILTKLITYPCEQMLSYDELVLFVQRQLPEKTEYIILAESFSGPIAYEIAKQNNENLKGIIFAASFIKPPNKYIALARLIPVSFSFLIPDHLPDFVLKFLLGHQANKSLYQLVNSALTKVKKNVLLFRIMAMAGLPENTQTVIKNCLYIQAKNDRLVASDNAIGISKISQKFQLFKLEGSHFVLQINPKECSKIVQNEMNRLRNK